MTKIFDSRTPACLASDAVRLKRFNKTKEFIFRLIAGNI
jgi:hypothetical protein